MSQIFKDETWKNNTGWDKGRFTVCMENNTIINK